MLYYCRSYWNFIDTGNNKINKLSCTFLFEAFMMNILRHIYSHSMLSRRVSSYKDVAIMNEISAQGRSYVVELEWLKITSE